MRQIVTRVVGLVFGGGAMLIGLVLMGVTMFYVVVPLVLLGIPALYMIWRDRRADIMKEEDRAAIIAAAGRAEVDALTEATPSSALPGHAQQPRDEPRARA